MQQKSHSFENTASWPPSSLLLLLDMSCNTGSSCDMCSTIFCSKLCHKYSLPISMFLATFERKRLYKLGSFNRKCTKIFSFFLKRHQIKLRNWWLSGILNFTLQCHCNLCPRHLSESWYYFFTTAMFKEVESYTFVNFA